MSDVIYAYTAEQAIEDGFFVDVTERAKEAGIKYPVAVTRNLWDSHIVPSDHCKEMGQSEQGRLWDLLNMFVFAARKANDSFIKFTVKFGGRNITVWAVCEATSPKDPSPRINIMLPEDY